MNKTIKNIAGLTAIEIDELNTLLRNASAAQRIAANYSQAQVDHLCQAVAWAISNKQAFQNIVWLSIEDSGLGDPVTRMEKRFKIRGILRDILRQKSVGVIEEIPEKGLVKYAKPVGVIGSVVPTNNPDIIPGGQTLFSIKSRNAIIFAPHPRTMQTTLYVCETIRDTLREQGAPENLVQCISMPSRLMTDALQQCVDLVICTAGKGRVSSAYFSGVPAYCAGAGNATMIFDETADIIEACHNTMLSKTYDYGSGCSSDSNLIIHESIFDAVVKQLDVEGGYLASRAQAKKLEAAIWNEDGSRLSHTIAIPAPKLANIAGFTIPADRKFICVLGGDIYEGNNFCREKQTTLIALFRYGGEIEQAIKITNQILSISGKGHSVGIFSYNNDHINQLGIHAPVSRVMVRQPLAKANSGSATNGMPMTTSLGCGTWGQNLLAENMTLKHYMNTTWVARPIAADMPAPEELFGKFYDPEAEM